MPPLSYGHFPHKWGKPGLAPGIPRSLRFACSRPFRFTKGALFLPSGFAAVDY